MRSSGLSAITLVPLVMAALSLLSMMGMFQINRIVQQDLYRYGLQFSIRWARPYWDISVFVFIVGWFNIILAVAFLLYVATYERRETKHFAAEVKKEIVNIETKSIEKMEEQTPRALTSSEIQEKEQKETSTPVTKEEPQQVSSVDHKGQGQVTPDQSVQSEASKEQESEPSKTSETQQEDMKPEKEEKKEETPIIIGLTEEELQTSS